MKRILLFLGVTASISSIAQQKDTTDLEPVEVKTIRASATAPFAKTNLNKKEIEKKNLGQDLPFVLNQTPSVVVNSDAGNGVGYTGIRIRGTDATRINVTINGVPFNDAESNGTYFVDLPDLLSSVNSIQIQRGVGTSSNGPGAFGGTINLSTNEVNKQPYFESNNSYGSFNTLKNTIRLGTGMWGKNFVTDLRLSRISSDGYVDRAKSNLKSYYFSTAYVKEKTTLRFTTFSGREKTYQAWYGVSEADLKTNRRINYAGMEKPGTPYENQTDNYTQTHYQLFLTQQLSPRLIFNTGLFYVKGKGYYEEYKADQTYTDYGLQNVTNGSTVITASDLVRQRWLDNDYYGDIFSLHYAKDKTQLTLGGAVTSYLGDHFGKVIWAEKGINGNSQYYLNDAKKKDGNVYLKWQQDLAKDLQFFTDFQVRRVNYAINGFDYNPGIAVNKTNTFFNPKAGLTYHKNNLTVFGSYGIANKEPNRDDFEASPNEQPRPERLNDVELGWESKGKKASVGATFYYMKYKDQLVLTGKINDVGSYTRTNIDESYRMGIELQGGAAIARWLKASANLTLSRNKVKNFREFYDDYDNGGQKSNLYKETDISFSPSAIGAATVTATPFRHFTVDLLSKYVGKQYLDNTSNEGRKLNPYFTEDVRLAYALQKGALKNADIIFQVNNVFDKKYEPTGYTYSYLYNTTLTTENYYYPMAGTTWTLGLNIRF
ncbi:TonB-dependent receptor [Flavisolibacter nicotianae]|uniref:TonB-dependent receptor n=1 Tax=Flavisolibacter nicotianae TaxID=2364882 RepID=UPI000EAF9E95|nr:TonB-dependent receptor plug domain-containing protein [Flavisolibacter nicotianae]